MDRRHFLASIPASLFVTGFPNLGFTRPKRDGRLIAIILEGGLDGLAAVPPLGDKNLHRLRQNLLLNDALKINPFFSLHPSFKNFGYLLSQNEASVVHATSFPYTKRSHFEGQNIVESGGVTPFAYTTGWLGRAMDLSGVSGRSLSLETPLLVRGNQKSESYFPAMINGSKTADMALIASLRSLYDGDALDTLELLEEQIKINRNKPKVRDAIGLAEYAGKQMQNSLGPKVAVIRVSEFDTHANQGQEDGMLSKQVKLVDDVISTLKTSLGSTWSDSIIVTLTEFGRTVGQNGSKGTDHGYGSTSLLAGGLIKSAGVVTDWPGLKKRSLFEERDLMATIDMRSVCSACIEAAFGLEHDLIADQVFFDRAIPRVYNEIFA